MCTLVFYNHWLSIFTSCHALRTFSVQLTFFNVCCAPLMMMSLWLPVYLAVSNLSALSEDSVGLDKIKFFVQFWYHFLFANFGLNLQV